MQSNIYKLPFAGISTYEQIEQYRDFDRQIKALTKDKEQVGLALKTGYFLDNDDFIHEGRLIATYRPQIKVSFDQEKFKTDHADMFKEYQRSALIVCFY